MTLQAQTGKSELAAGYFHEQEQEIALQCHTQFGPGLWPALCSFS